MSKDLTKRLAVDDRATLAEILATVKSLDTRVGSLETHVLSIDKRVGSLETQVLNIDKRVGSIDIRLATLEKTVEERLYDTRPIWEKVQTDIGQLQTDVVQLREGQQRLQEGQLRLEEGQEFLRRESHEVHTLLRDIFRRLSIFNDTLVTMQADYRDIYDRVRDIERQRN